MCRAMEEMRKETAAETLLVSIKNLMKSQGWSVEQAMAALGVSESDKAELMKQL